MAGAPPLPGRDFRSGPRRFRHAPRQVLQKMRCLWAPGRERGGGTQRPSCTRGTKYNIRFYFKKLGRGVEAPTAALYLVSVLQRILWDPGTTASIFWNSPRDGEFGGGMASGSPPPVSGSLRLGHSHRVASGQRAKTTLKEAIQGPFIYRGFWSIQAHFMKATSGILSLALGKETTGQAA